MRYMFLIYTKEESLISLETAEAVMTGHRMVMDDAFHHGIFQAADPLEPTCVATTVRVRNATVLTTDGPFAETKEQLAGYYILDCKDLDEALAWAARMPTACGGGEGCVEVRPIREMRRRTRFVHPDPEYAGTALG